MKRYFVCFVALSLLFVSCSPPPPPATTPTNTSAPDLFDTPWDDRVLFKGGLVDSEQAVLNELPNASVYHLEFNIGSDIFRVTGMEEVRYTNAEDVTLNEVQLRLFPNILGGEMTVSHLTVDGNLVTPTYQLENKIGRAHV